MSSGAVEPLPALRVGSGATRDREPSRGEAGRPAEPIRAVMWNGCGCCCGLPDMVGLPEKVLTAVAGLPDSVLGPDMVRPESVLPSGAAPLRVRPAAARMGAAPRAVMFLARLPRSALSQLEEVSTGRTSRATKRTSQLKGMAPTPMAMVTPHSSPFRAFTCAQQVGNAMGCSA